MQFYVTRCTNCQNEINVENKFCKKCGTKNPDFQGRTESDVIIPADETMAWDSNIPSPPSNIPSGKSSSNVSSQPSNVPVHRRSAAWYLLPIFFTWLGGLIAFLVIRKDDPKKARNCLILGIILVLIYFIFFGIFVRPFL